MYFLYSGKVLSELEPNTTSVENSSFIQVFDKVLSEVEPNKTPVENSSFIQVFDKVLSEVEPNKTPVENSSFIQVFDKVLSWSQFVRQNKTSVVVVVEVQAILRPPRSGALALPHNEDVKVKCSWAANLGKSAKCKSRCLPLPSKNKETTDAHVRLKKGALPFRILNARSKVGI